MATYEELFNQLQPELDAAYEHANIQEGATKAKELSDLHMELGFSLIAEMNYSTASDQFNAAYQVITGFQNWYAEQVKLTPVDPAQVQEVDTLRADLKENSQVSAAYVYYCTALFNNINRNPGLAVSYFEKAEESFQELAPKQEYMLFAKYCKALKIFAEGYEEFYRANFANAKTKFQQSKVLFEKLIGTDLEQIKEQEDLKGLYDILSNAFQTDYRAVKSIYFTSDAKYQFNNRNFKNALKQFGNVVVESEMSLKTASAGGDLLKYVTAGDYHLNVGWKLLAEAEVFRESELWDQAFGNYELVKKEWEEASDSYLSSGHPSATVLQETVLNQSLTIDTYQAVCQTEKDLKEEIAQLQGEIDELKGKLFDAVKPMGVVVNNTQDMVNTVEQNAQFIQTIENNARESIQELLTILKTVPMAEPEKKKIETQATEVLASKEKGPKFLDKVKSFTKDVGEVIKNVGEIAAPLVPVLKFLSIL